MCATTSSPVELLAPAGGVEQFYAALAAGADAIYCGVDHSFNLRQPSVGLDFPALALACERAHLVGARVYVPMNAVIHNEEMDTALHMAERLWRAGADALIVADWGFISLLQEALPQIELHLSTQANVQDRRGVRFARERGLRRVTLSRELSVHEIAEVAKEGLDLEVFCHGSLCYSYAGTCYMSSWMNGRSANRGLCTQPCRLPATIVDRAGTPLGTTHEKRPRPLCMRDCCAYDDLPALMQAGVMSLKIEGRMKSADYVFGVVSAYREALDRMGAGICRGWTKDGREKAVNGLACRTYLQRVYNRGYTNANLHGSTGNELMNFESGDNQGRRVGEVVLVRDLETLVPTGKNRTKKRLMHEVHMLLSDSVGQGDRLCLQANDSTRRFEWDAPQAYAAGETMVHACSQSIPVGSVVLVTKDAALKRETAEAVAHAMCEKTYAGLDTRVLAAYDDRKNAPAYDLGPGLFGGGSPVVCRPKEATVCVLAPTPAHARTALAAGADCIYAAVDALDEWYDWPAGVIPLLDEVCHQSDWVRLDPYVRRGERVVTGNVAGCAIALERGAKLELWSTIPLLNRHALQGFASQGITGAWLSFELSPDEIEHMAKACPLELGVIVYGRLRLMTNRRCVLKAIGTCANDYGHCAWNSSEPALRMADGTLLPIRTDARGRSRIYAAEPIDAAAEIPRLWGAGISRFGIDASLLSVGETTSVVLRVSLAAKQAQGNIDSSRE